jgi:hypothetical protein
LVDQFGSSDLLLRRAREVGRSTTLRATDGQHDKTTRRCLGASQDSQSKLGGRDEQCLAESFGINAAANIPVAMSASAQMRSAATSVIFPLLCEKRKSDRHPQTDKWRSPRIMSSPAPPVRASEARPARQHAGDHAVRRAIATSRANATSIVGRDFRPNHTEQRAIAAPRAFNGLCDDEGVPLICPTCQVLPPKRPCRRPPATLHGVVFDIFCWEPQRRGAAARILLEAAHASQAFAVAKCRAAADEDGHHSFAVAL